MPPLRSGRREQSLERGRYWRITTRRPRRQLFRQTHANNRELRGKISQEIIRRAMNRSAGATR
jgi:hypothetical protein